MKQEIRADELDKIQVDGMGGWQIKNYRVRIYIYTFLCQIFKYKKFKIKTYTPYIHIF